MHIRLTSEQCRAARALLNWSIRDLSDKSGVHRNTVANIESDKVAHQPTLFAVRRTFEDAGVIFIDPNGDGPGARLRRAKATPDPTE
jgi:transcriptional regulator with XRE-family HTH domain